MTFVILVNQSKGWDACILDNKYLIGKRRYKNVSTSCKRNENIFLINNTSINALLKDISILFLKLLLLKLTEQLSPFASKAKPKSGQSSSTSTFFTSFLFLESDCQFE